jgi:putative DNA primase/helicase
MERPNLNQQPSLTHLTSSEIKNHMENLQNPGLPLQHHEIFGFLLGKLQPVNFDDLAFGAGSIKNYTADPDTEIADGDDDKSPDRKIRRTHYLVLAVDIILEEATKINLGLCKNNDCIMLYNGCYWKEVNVDEFQKFLGDAAERLGVPEFSSRFYLFKEQLYKQFLSRAHLPSPEEDKKKVLINLKNGTLEISQEGTILQPFNSANFLTYQLPYVYDPEAEAPLFNNYLDHVLPDKESQKVLLEYIGSSFIKQGSGLLKLEKVLILFGSGANGKSVFFEIINALLGKSNISNFSLQSLTNENGYYRAKIANKLINYASEINGKLETSIFKILASGEPVEARHPYGQPFMLTQYARLIFNCNELPKDVEQTNGFFRRFLIVSFLVTIPPEQQDKNLHTKIISSEMPGILNLVISSLRRLIEQQGFTESEAVNKANEQYKMQSDSVKMFLFDSEISISITSDIPLKDLFVEYRSYCYDSNLRECSRKTFSDRLRNSGYELTRKSFGMVVNAEKKRF